MNYEYEIWDGDMFLFVVKTAYEADEAQEAGFNVVEVPREEVYSD